MGDLSPRITAGPVSVRPGDQMQQRQRPASAPEPNATPLCRKLAARYGVDLRTVKATGVGGRITKGDVLRHPVAAVQIQAAAMTSGLPAAAAPVMGSGQTTTVRSTFGAGQMVATDPYGPNPLAEDARQFDPESYAAAVRISAPPTPFAAGALPTFTASGIDPRDLAKLPWQARLVVAGDSDPGRVYAAFQEYVDDPEAAAFDLERDDRVQEYRTAMRSWLHAGTDLLRTEAAAIPVQRPNRLG